MIRICIRSGTVQRTPPGCAAQLKKTGRKYQLHFRPLEGSDQPVLPADHPIEEPVPIALSAELDQVDMNIQWSKKWLRFLTDGLQILERKGVLYGYDEDDEAGR